MPHPTGTNRSVSVSADDVGTGVAMHGHAAASGYVADDILAVDGIAAAGHPGQQVADPDHLDPRGGADRGKVLLALLLRCDLLGGKLDSLAKRPV